MGRQHQGMDRPGVRQVPEGNGEQGKMEETDCEIICGAPTTLAVKRQMMMMMMMMMKVGLAMSLKKISWYQVSSGHMIGLFSLTFFSFLFFSFFLFYNTRL